MVQTIKFSQFSTASLNDSSRTVVGTATGANYILPDQNQWTTITRPLSPYDGLMGYNTTLHEWEYWQNSTLQWLVFSSGGGGTGTVTFVNTGTGLTGGPITTTGTISLAAIANNTLLANTVGISAAPVPTSISTLFDSIFGVTQGAIIYRGASAWSALNPGSNGQFLETQGPAANPQWANPAGTGTVNAGSQNQMAWYASNGTAVSGLATANNGILKTSSIGVPSISSTAPVGLTLPQPLIQGVTNGSSSPAGDVGEFISSIVLSAAKVPFIATNTPIDVTSIALTAGKWLVWGNVTISIDGTGTAAVAWSSTTSATQPNSSFLSGNTDSSNLIVNGGEVLAPIVQLFYNLNAPATVYLSCNAQYSSSTASGAGGIYALRVG